MEQHRYRALLIGNSTFPEDPHNLPELRGPINDLALLRDALTNLTTGLFEPEYVRLVPERTKPQIMGAIERFFRSAGRDDTLLLYYSGHGQQDTIGNLFLCARETRIDYLVSTAISDSEINNIMRDSNAQTFVVILDCCHSGAFKGTGTPTSLQGTGRFLLTSSRRRELSADSTEETGPSAFTSHLVEALRLGTLDNNRDGYVSLNDVYDYVLNSLRQATGQIPQRHIDNAIGDVIIARAATSQPIASWSAAPPPRDRPVLDLSDTEIRLPDVYAGEQVPAEMIEVFNRGGGELRWTAESSDPWITITQERDRFWLYFAPLVGANRGRVSVRDHRGGGAKVVRVTQRVFAVVTEPAMDLSRGAAAWEPGGQPYETPYRPRPATRWRRYVGAAAVAVALLVAAGVIVWSWLSDLSHTVRTYEPVARLVAGAHYDPVRSEYVCGDKVGAGIVLQVLIDDPSQVPVATWSGLTDKGKTISEGTALLFKVSNGQSCPH